MDSKQPFRRGLLLVDCMKQLSFIALIESHYPKPGNGRRPMDLEQMLRIYFLQQWFNLSDPGVEDALYESPTLLRFAGIDLGAAPTPDETTMCSSAICLKSTTCATRPWTR